MSDEIETTETESPRDITARAFDAVMGETEREAPAAPAEAGDEEAAPSGRARDESGRFAKQEKDRADGERPVTATPKGKAGAPPQPAQGREAAVSPAAAPSPTSALKAPASWKPQFREKFAALPPEMQEEIVRVNRETQKVLQENAQLRQQADGGWGKVTQPFENSIRARGAEPQAFVSSLLQTEHALSTAPPQHKAAIVAQLCAQYGVEPQHLDAALVAVMQGRQPAQGQPQQRQAEFRDPRLDTLLQRFETEAKAREEAQASEADDRAGAFGESHEWYDDVREQMSLMLQTMAAQGKKQISDEELERVYTAACLTHPDVAPLFEQRRAAQQAQQQRATVQRSKAAAASIRSKPAADGPAPKGKLSPRQITEQAFEELEGRV